ncbi:hypothetical protein VTO42DRAFT_5002 [Malbranchea cinnamomea]
METSPATAAPILETKPKLPPSPTLDDAPVDSTLASGNTVPDAPIATVKLADSTTTMDPKAANQAAVQENGSVTVNGHSEHAGQNSTTTNGVSAQEQPAEQPQPQATPAPVDGLAVKSDQSHTAGDSDAASQSLANTTAHTSNGTVPPAEEPTQPISPKKEEDVSSVTADAKPTATQATNAAAPVSPPAEKPAEASSTAPSLPAQQSTADRDMPDAPPLSPTKVAREREEDASDEPAAKRPKTDESLQGDAQPKTSELPASSAATGAESATTSTDQSVITPYRKKFLQRTFQTLKRMHDSRFFRVPVDPVKLNIPSYPLIIKHPMDLSTMEEKLKTDRYQTVDQVVADMQLMINNTVTFNGPEHIVTLEGKKVQEAFERHLTKLPGPEEVELTPAQKKASKKASTPAAKPQSQREPRASAPKKSATTTSSTTFALGPEGLPLIRRDSSTADGRPKRTIHPPKNRDLPYSTKPKKKKYQWELKFCQEVLDELHKPKYFSFAAPFYQPVDPVALNIPTYHSIIKKPMDLQTMHQKLNAGSYENAKEFEADMRLMFKNCYKFNIPGDPVYTSGKKLEELFQHKWNQKARWLEAHEPHSARQSSSDESDEEVDSDEEDQEKLSELQRQIAEMSKQVEDIKRKRKTPPGASKKGTKSKSKTESKKSSSKKDKKSGPKPKPEKRWISYQEKQMISNGISTLPEKRMAEALKIIQNNVSSPLKQSEDGEIELDMDELPNEVLHLLLDFVKRHAPGPLEFEDEPAPEPLPAMAPTKPKKNKPMSKHEQESKINALQKTLESFSGGGGHSSDPAQVESSDDEEETEESEEE